MDKKGRIRLSTMEIVLLLTLGASLALGLLQAYQQTRLDDARSASCMRPIAPSHARRTVATPRLRPVYHGGGSAALRDDFARQAFCR